MIETARSFYYDLLGEHLKPCFRPFMFCPLWKISFVCQIEFTLEIWQQPSKDHCYPGSFAGGSLNWLLIADWSIDNLSRSRDLSQTIKDCIACVQTHCPKEVKVCKTNAAKMELGNYWPGSVPSQTAWIDLMRGFTMPQKESWLKILDATIFSALLLNNCPSCLVVWANLDRGDSVRGEEENFTMVEPRNTVITQFLESYRTSFPLFALFQLLWRCLSCE